MTDSGKESTDGASIKPVSSLRSHFEKIANSKPTSGFHAATVAQKQPSLPRHSGEILQPFERTSLDIPRRLSPLFSSRDSNVASSLQEAEIHRENEIHMQRTRPSLHRRPISMSSLTSARPSPTVTVHSPKSPPKPLALPAIHSPPRPASGSSSRSAELRHQSPSHSLFQGGMPRQNSNHPGATLAIASNPAAFNSNAPTKRVEKPKVPSKPAAISSNKLAIGPDFAAGAEGKRLSPFSTPSGDDESLESGLPKGFLTSELSNRHWSNAKEKGENYFEPRLAHGVVQKKPMSVVSGFEFVASADDTSQKFTSHLLSSNTDSLENRPGLPPRRENDQRSRTTAPARNLTRTWTEHNKIQKSPTPQIKLRVPSGASQPLNDTNNHLLEFRPPPKRSQTSIGQESARNERVTPHTQGRLTETDAVGPNKRSYSLEPQISKSNYSVEFPDASFVNRRPPLPTQGIKSIDTNYDTKLLEISNRYICTTGYLTKAWDVTSGELIMNLSHGEKETRVTALAFRPGAGPEEEGVHMWLGTNCGDLLEADISTQKTLHTKSAVHGRREIIKILRCQNSMWTLDDDGKLYIWPADDSGVPNLHSSPYFRRVPKGHSFSIVIQDTLWLATGKEIRIYRPNSADDSTFLVQKEPLNQNGVGEVTSGAIIPDQLHLAYFGHADGKVTVYSTIDFACLGIYNVSVYKINSLAGAGSCLWAGYSTGIISVYSTDTQPWTTKKEWQAHDHPVAGILTDLSSIWKSGLLRVASIGTDNSIKLWDGRLEHDWLEKDMQDHDIEYCNFREIVAKVVTWNAGASTPTNLRYNEKNLHFFHQVLDVEAPPEILVFGFQELVDLEDKRLTAKSLFKGNKKKDSSEHEHISRQYRAWRDYLVRCIEDAMPSDEPYHLLHTASMVGLFTCVFVKTSERSRIKNLSTAEVKRGMGGLHGNKGALILRFRLDDSSLCLINCHLAAGQTQTVHRNNDIAAIIDAVVLPPEQELFAHCDAYVGGGDGSMILDHEICVLNGDLNYRIDTMGRDTVIKAVQSNNYTRLLERDQLLVSRRRNPVFRLRAFKESPILFAPTYKYDVGSDTYDTSEKHRAPAWCDRILYRGAGNIKPLEYRRHELQVSDHRPVSATFKMRIKKVIPNKRDQAWEACKVRFEAFKQKTLYEAKIGYLRDVLGVDVEAAKNLIKSQD